MTGEKSWHLRFILDKIIINSRLCHLVPPSVVRLLLAFEIVLVVGSIANCAALNSKVKEGYKPASNKQRRS